MPLHIEEQQKGHTLVLKLAGVMDYSTIDGFEPSIPEKTGEVVVDFSALDFIDSTGIGAILLIIHSAHEQDAAVKFTGLDDNIKELFDTVGVFRILESLRKRGR
ncbi:STAS domain-containing protein [Cohnella pontilimi]|uniref:STAS domain-containing protein n=1 Tax=Cohnella pontilimi TaxID=2564100 RepID=A0A4U0FDJ0_9BACL|nr:STAS domain-containing protein [Cohnella pontilimi]TJY42850.1 STAS domain-containing protein [Cohnella pontilimi]